MRSFDNFSLVLFLSFQIFKFFDHLKKQVIKNNTRQIPVPRSKNVTDVLGLTLHQKKNYVFILLGTGIFLALFYIHPIVPYASAFFAQFYLK